jgi:DNA-binding HxlR family transcriptional regulator
METEEVETDDTRKLAVWCAGEEWCPITATAELIGKKWHPVIVHRLLETGPTGFNSLKDEVGGISSKVLSESLEDLREKGLVEKEVLSESPKRVQYSLTQQGENLRPVIQEMMDWGRQHLAEPS